MTTAIAPNIAGLTARLRQQEARTLALRAESGLCARRGSDARLKKSTERIERLRAQLAAHLQQAEALLAESPVSG